MQEGAEAAAVTASRGKEVRKAEGEGEGEEEKMGQGLSMSQKLTLAYAALVGGNAFPPE